MTTGNSGKRIVSLKLRLIEFVRRRLWHSRTARRSSRKTCKDWAGAKSGRADDRICPALCDLQARQSDSGGMQRLAAMVNDPKRPVQFVFAGKAHPRDEPGKRVLQQSRAR